MQGSGKIGVGVPPTSFSREILREAQHRCALPSLVFFLSFMNMHVFVSLLFMCVVLCVGEGAEEGDGGYYLVRDHQY